MQTTLRTAFLILVTTVVATGCGTTTYRPVQEIEFNQLADDGCKRKGDRFAVTAQINSSSRETIVLWDGYNTSRTVAVRLPKQGLGSRFQDKVGSSRYDVAFEQINQLRDRNTPVTVTMRCERADMAPAADRFSYYENGQRVQFEF